MEEYKPEKQLIEHRSILIPPHYQAIAIVGQRESGKTSILPKLLGLMAEPRYLFLYTKSPEQPVFRFLRDSLPNTKILQFTELSMAPIERRRELLVRYPHSVVIIDDFTNDLEQMADLWTRGRHLNLSVIITIQRWFLLPMVIRQNCTGVILFSLTNVGKTLEAMPDFGIITPRQLRRAFTETTTKPYGFLTLWTQPDVPSWMRIREGFDKFITDLLPTAAIDGTP